jgi:hypothetical protein
VKYNEEIGSDLELMIAMLEKSEIDYTEDEDGEDEDLSTTVDINDTVRMVFDEEGNLIEVNPIPN